MATHARHAHGLATGQMTTTAGVGRFLWHLVQMLIAMMAGMMLYHLLAGKSTDANKVLWYAGMELSMIPPMLALMLYQRHGWRCSIEMAAAMLVGPAIFLACAQFGWHTYVPGLTRNSLFGLSDATMYLGMLGVMLYRREMYTRPHARSPRISSGDVGGFFRKVIRSGARHFVQH